MTYVDGLFMAGLFGKPEQVCSQMCSAVRIHIAWRTAVAVTPLVWCDYVIPSLCKGDHLVSPTVGRLGKPMRQDNEWRAHVAAFVNYEFHPVN
jgi:hypothetical protein